MGGPREQRPEHAVDDVRERRNVDVAARARKLLERREHRGHARRRPPVDLLLFLREVAVRQGGFLPRAVRAEIAKIARERAGEQRVQPGADAAARARTKIEAAQRLEEIVHQHEEHLAFGSKVLVEAADRDAGAPRDRAD